MHHSFTGSTKRSRQVNLSGRSTVNPWAALPASARPPTTSGTHDPLAQAQADRARRQQDRDKLNATRTIQRTWRSHSCRQAQKRKWRGEWDLREQERLQRLDKLPYEELTSHNTPVAPYPSEDVLLRQLRLLAFFLDVRIQNDIFRLLYFGSALSGVTRGYPPISPEVTRWERHITKLRVQVSRAIFEAAGKNRDNDSIDRNLLGLLQVFDAVSPISNREIAVSTFSSIIHLLDGQSTTAETYSEVVLGTYRSILKSRSQVTYDAFAVEVLGNPVLSRQTVILEQLTHFLDLGALATSIIRQRGITRIDLAQASMIAKELWCLAYLTYFFLNSNLAAREDSTTTELIVQAMSILLSDCANFISAQSEQNQSLPDFQHEWLGRLCAEGNVRNIISLVGQRDGIPLGRRSSYEPAKQLANYAVALLRAFPERAMDIRMWLFSGSIAMTSTTKLSTIQYFWQAAKSTSVFGRIAQDQRQVLSILTEAVPHSNQLYQAPIAEDTVQAWQDDWRLIMLFLELYTFILKLMDDEEFFALSNTDLGVGLDSPCGFDGHLYRNSLPMKDVAIMTTFLKNLAFTLYWNAADLADSNELEESGGISALFGNPVSPPTRATSKPKPSTLAGNGLSQAYLKGVTTGLLRMLHERDSRRKFLPESHWLMTSQFDMSGFITAVVAEEERRHEFGDDIDEDEEEIVDGYIETGRSVTDSSEIGAPGTSVNLLRSVFGIRPAHTTLGYSAQQAELFAKRREQARKQRQLESLAPRLEILRNLPFFIPFDTRVQIFREFVYRDQMRRRGGFVDPDHWRISVARASMGRAPDGRPQGMDVLSRHHAEIRRGHVVEDAFDQFFDLGEALKEPIQISFIDKFGQPEAGIDGGGVTKEFLMSVVGEGFDPEGHECPYFVENSQHCLYPNPTVFEQTKEYLRRAKGLKGGEEEWKRHLRELLQYYEFLGRIIGKCLYEGILVDVTFAGFFLLKWALTGGTTIASKETAYRASINDVREFDEELYQGLIKLKNYHGDVEADFGLDFTVTDTVEFTDKFGQKSTKPIVTDLVPHGSNKMVTNTNRLTYINQIVRYRLQIQPQLVTNAFLKGLGQMIQPMWLSMFNQKELQKLVGGDNAELDIADLRRNTQYGGLYVIGDDGLEHPTVKMFWSVLERMTDQDRRKVLKFVTSTPRAPLLGFSHLNPKFSIRDSSEDQERLPSTSTCVNLLKLPRYGNEKTMMEKMLYAVNSGAGFDLS